MAIYHLSAQVISAAGGRSAVAAAAYRRAASMTCDATGQVFSYEGKEHVTHTELSLPAETPVWLRAGIDEMPEHDASAFLWNAVERKEGLRGTGLAMEMNIALPVDLTTPQNVVLARDWIEEHVTARGFVADWAVHDISGNPHFHVMIPLRRASEDGFAAKFDLARDPSGRVLMRPDGKPRYERMAAPMKELIAWRRSWADTANRHLAAAGMDLRIDHRSHLEAGIEIEPTGHVGVTASNMAAAGKEAARIAEERERRARNAEAIIEDPSRILPIVTRERSVFDERDIAKALFRYIDDPAVFEAVRLRVGLSPELVAVAPEIVDPDTDAVITPARWTTKTLLTAEVAMQVAAGRLWTDRSHALPSDILEAALSARSNLSDQQREAVRHVTAPDRVAVVVGFAGAGKSTMLGVANDAWTRAGYRVHGAALAGKAADGLQRSAGIVSRTLASWELAWRHERDCLGRGDVFVLDEAGMVSSEQLSRIVREVERRGAKLVLVGDAMQLQPIEAGAAFRAITETVGYAELSEIWRQSDPAMRAASVSFARGEVAAAISHYRDAGMVRFTPTREAARQALITAWKADYLGVRADGRRNETLILAHANQDVFALNALARETLKANGHLAIEGEARFVTARGERLFSPGDRLLFLENDARLGVKNGMLASVVTAGAGLLTVRLDQDGMGDGRLVEVRAAEYRNIDHGYAATVHKAQGATLDQVHVLATPGMDRHLAYVAMTRHRHGVVLHASHADFLGERQRRALDGRLGKAPARADYDAAALAGLVRRMSRDGTKETTLDYLGNEEFREAVVALDRVPSPAGLEALARRLDAAEEHARLTADRVRPQDIRALASAFAERRSLDGHGALLPGMLVRLRAVLQGWQRRWHRLNEAAARLDLLGHRARAEATRSEIQTRPVFTEAAPFAPAPVRVRLLPPFLPATLIGARGLEEAASARMRDDDPNLTEKRGRLGKDLAAMVRMPDRLLAEIVGMLPRPSGDFARHVDALLAAPEAHGGLNGKAGLFASKADRQDRATALSYLPLAQASARRLKAAFDQNLAAARQAELAYRERLRIEIPGLSLPARTALQAVGATAAGERDPVMVRWITPELRPEIEAFARAVGRRFGANGSAGYGMEASLPPDHPGVDEEMRHLIHGAGLVASHIAKETLDDVLNMTQCPEKNRDLKIDL